MQTHPLLKKIRTILSYRVFTSSIFVLLALLVFGVLIGNIRPPVYNVELFETADVTIRAPKTIIDEEKTKEKREKAAAEVEKVYIHKEETLENRMDLINSIFSSVESIIYQNNKQKIESQSAEDPETDEKKTLTLSQQLDSLKKGLTENAKLDVTETLSDEVLLTLLTMSETDRKRVQSIVISQVDSVMSEKVLEGQEIEAENLVENRLRSFNLSTAPLNLAISLTQLAIVPTDIYDEIKTEEKRNEALLDVKNEEIIEGQVIVQSGQMIDHEIYRQLELLDLVSSEGSSKPYWGLVIFVLVIISTLYYYFYNWEIKEEKKQNYIILTSVIFIISLLIMKIVGLMEKLEVSEIGFLFPAAFAGMILRILLNERIAMVMIFILSGCASIVFHNQTTGAFDIEIAMYTLFSGISGILFLANRKQRTNILQAGLYVSIVNLFIILFLLLLKDTDYSRMEYIFHAIYALVSGVGSAVLTIGFLPFFEAGFGIISAMKLIELSNPNHPLLKKLLTEAPGTYHHSVMVANLAEAACESIGANGLLARVGCYYHDLGKTRRPHFFIENQMNMENPHDRLSPETSKKIIIGHTTDGAKMLRKYKLPKELVDIAEQHHGTSLLKFFYYKAKQENPDVVEEDYRYPGPKPQSKEAAIVSIADSVEAAVRSMTAPTPEEIRKLVENIVQDRLQDGQFNECDLTLKELQTIKKTFCETVNGIFHSRIEYPETQSKGVST